MSSKEAFQRLRLADAYTRKTVSGYIHCISTNWSIAIPSIIYELCVSFYYAGEHFAYLGEDMYITSVSSSVGHLKSGRDYNNVVDMTTFSKWNTCYGQVVADTTLNRNYIYEWTFETSGRASIGFGISTDIDKTDDAFWIHSQTNPSAMFYGFTAFSGERLSMLSSASSNWRTFGQSLHRQHPIKLIFNIEKKTLECVIKNPSSSSSATANNSDKSAIEPILISGIATNNLKYYLSIAMCGQFSVRLLDFQRIHKGNVQMMNTLKRKSFGELKFKNVSRLGDIHVATLSANWNLMHKGDILTLKAILADFETIKTTWQRRQFIKGYCRKAGIHQLKAVEEVYGLIEAMILMVTKQKYGGNVTFAPNYFENVSDFVEWICYDSKAMNHSTWNVDDFAMNFDEWVLAVMQ